MRTFLIRFGIVALEVDNVVAVVPAAEELITEVGEVVFEVVDRDEVMTGTNGVASCVGRDCVLPPRKYLKLIK